VDESMATTSGLDTNLFQLETPLHCHFKLYRVVRRMHQILPGAEVARGRLHRGMAE
jgi:hypothetical protein